MGQNIWRVMLHFGAIFTPFFQPKSSKKRQKIKKNVSFFNQDPLQKKTQCFQTLSTNLNTRFSPRISQIFLQIFLQNLVGNSSRNLPSNQIESFKNLLQKRLDKVILGFYNMDRDPWADFLSPTWTTISNQSQEIFFEK